MAAGTKAVLEVDDSYRPSDFKIVKEVVKLFTKRMNGRQISDMPGEMTHPEP